MNPSLVWFRQDLRLQDNPALQAAIARGGAVIPVYLWSPEEEGSWAPGSASRWWLHQSLNALDQSLRARGSRLIFRRGPCFSELRRLLEQTHADAVFWNQRYEPLAVQRDRGIEKRLAEEGFIAQGFNGALLFEPWEVCTRSGTPFKVFTPFWRACLARRSPPTPLASPDAVASPSRWPESIDLEGLGISPSARWTEKLARAWNPGEEGAASKLGSLAGLLAAYPLGRDQPGIEGSSRLSPHLHFGEISPRRIWHSLEDPLRSRATGARGRDVFLREMGWREFAHHVLYHFPHTPEKPMRSEFAAFPWARRPAELAAWQRGKTGYPLVDAGMRELWATGWMHNRVRMVVASFLVKDLRNHWLEGARWFWETLVDADLANNTLGWQWCAGCGADAAPYFRIFNPVLQGEKFDGEGSYVRKWVPELARMPKRWIHRPFEAPDRILTEAGVRLGVDYPRPLVDHSEARARALMALAEFSRDEED
jgi:deoxyribodipyrimidine photo-lyase